MIGITARNEIGFGSDDPCCVQQRRGAGRADAHVATRVDAHAFASRGSQDNVPVHVADGTRARDVDAALVRRIGTAARRQAQESIVGARQGAGPTANFIGTHSGTEGGTNTRITESRVEGYTASGEEQSTCAGIARNLGYGTGTGSLSGAVADSLEKETRTVASTGYADVKQTAASGRGKVAIPLARRVHVQVHRHTTERHNVAILKQPQAAMGRGTDFEKQDGLGL